MFCSYACSHLQLIHVPESLSWRMVLQIEKLSDVVEACAAFRQCHTAAKCPLPPEFEGIGHSVPVTQNCLYRWIEEKLSDTVLHEQPERHHGGEQ